MNSIFEREANLLEKELQEERVTIEEYNQAMTELERDYRAEAEQSAQEAYDEELSRW